MVHVNEDRQSERAEPEAAEVESAALLANESAERLPQLDQDEVRKLADLFIAEGNDGGAEVFVPWALKRISSDRRQGAESTSG